MCCSVSYSGHHDGSLTADFSTWFKNINYIDLGTSPRTVRVFSHFANAFVVIAKCLLSTLVFKNKAMHKFICLTDHILVHDKTTID